MEADDKLAQILQVYAERKLGDDVSHLFIGVPHQLPPLVRDAHFSPPEEDDAHVCGDHDYHRCVDLIGGLTYRGHQQIRVRLLAARELRHYLHSHWQERATVQEFRGAHYQDADFQAAAHADVLAWDGCWPVIDADFCLTGDIDDGSDGMVNINDEAMMSQEDADLAGLAVEDGVWRG
jgi:hypothetical protein